MITCTLNNKKYTVDFITAVRFARWNPPPRCMVKS